jgi:hypothetical protein
MTRLALITASGAAAMALIAPTHAAAAPSATSFHGSCAIVGTDVASHSSSVFRGHGVCVGSLNGGHVVRHQVIETVRQHGMITPDYFGLPAIHGGSNGVGSLNFGTSTVRFVIQQSVTSFTVEGTRQGIGSGTATAMPEGMLRLTMTTCNTDLAG